MSKILHICPSLPDTSLYYDLITSLSINDIEQIVYVPLSGSKKFGQNEIAKENVETIYSNCFTQIDRLLYFSKRNKIFNDLDKRTDMKNIDLIHAHYLFSGGGVALKMRLKYGLDYIVAVRNTDINFFWKKMPHLRSHAYKILKEAYKIIFISPSSLDKFLNKMLPEKIKASISEKCIVIPNGLNKFWFENKETLKHTYIDEFRLIYAGSLNKNKNILKVLEAVSEIRNTRQVRIKIIGKGNLYNKIKKTAEKEDWITLKKWMNKKELIKEYRSSHLFIMPSIHETFGLVYLEALSQGLPILHSIEQGVDGLFNDSQYAFKADPSSKNNIMQEILKVIESYDKLEYDVDLERFRWSNIADQYFAVYNSKRENN